VSGDDRESVLEFLNNLWGLGNKYINFQPSENGKYKYDLANTSLGYSLGHGVTSPPAIYIVSPDMLS
jgi:hypothetical protein